MLTTRISILGIGWLGLPLATTLNQIGYPIQGSYSNTKRKNECCLLPFPTEYIRISNNGITGPWSQFIENTDILIINIPPKKNLKGDIPFYEYIQQIIKYTPANKSVIFISSTSVYGDIDHKISEQTPPQPKTLSGKILLQSEQALKAHFKSQLTILRLAGLVGPQRNPGRFLANRKNVPNPNGLVNLTHREDCIHLITLIIKNQIFGHTINICSDEHPTRKIFYTKAAKCLQLPPPEFIKDSNLPTKYIDNSFSKEILNHKYLTIDEILEKC